MITPDFRTTLVEAAAGIARELAPPSDHEADLLVVELSRAIALIGGNRTPEQINEWQNAAADELEQFPWSLIATAIADARRRVRYAGDFVPTVIAAIEEPMRRLVAEADAIDRLLQISEG
ncbi:hypothetical protein HRJ34_14825 [Rhizorhabdus wittichii]|uniref:Uncharacterized protein n=1 Tax=Rhizorhabdus wittichii TaxID=160791 RepID=A0A975HBZ5_9SPHN|nr:hypothetical protein [Rhizorhabdus wittichii]QTH19647.1 hypothetical protein HRJ34_14825 [Rhizorhabdus wittichii]